MIKALTILVLGLSVTAQADICGQYLPCGNFTGSNQFQGQVVANEEMSVSSATDGNMRITGKMSELTGQVDWQYDFEMAFNADGTFTLLRSGTRNVMGSGVCVKNLCTYATRPSAQEGLSGMISCDGKAITRSHLLQDASGKASLYISTMLTK